MEHATNQHENKILLIEPPFYRLFKDRYSLDRYPLSLAYLAAVIRKESNWSVMVYNADFHPQIEQFKLSYMSTKGFSNYLNSLKDLSKPIWRSIKSTIAEYSPRLVGISAKSQNYASTCIVAKLTKEVDDDIVVIVGGPHASMVGSHVLDCADIDVAVKGEGERTIVELLNAVVAEEGFDHVQGIVYRRGSRIVENSPRQFIGDLDSLPFPNETAQQVLKDFHQYPPSAFENIFATRGCPYNCFFCGSRNIWGQKVRFRSPENVTREIKNLQSMGHKEVSFADDTFGVSKEHINNLCSALIRDCPEVRWQCEFHVRLVEKETISLMKAAGCYSIKVGIESGNNQILRLMRKNITIEEAVTACRIIKKQGIRLEAFFMIGFPHETESSLKDTVAAMKKVKADTLVYSIFTPYPGTEAFAFCRDKGLITEDFDVSLYNHQSPANCFCLGIRRERFRILASKIENTIDRKDSLKRERARVSLLFSLSTLPKMRELGIRKSLRIGTRVLAGK